MCVHWYFAEHFSDLSYRFFSKSKVRILGELRVLFKKVSCQKFLCNMNQSFANKTQIDKFRSIVNNLIVPNLLIQK